MRKESKFGYGGMKRGLKRNTAESSADMSGFNLRRNKAPFGSFAGSKPSKFGKRPGKRARHGQ